VKNQDNNAKRKPSYLVIKQALSEQGPLYPKELGEILVSEGFSERSVYGTLKRMKESGEVIVLGDGRYADSLDKDHKETFLKDAINKQRGLLLRNPTRDETLNYLGWNTEDPKEQERFHSLAFKIKWTPPNERQKKESRIKRTLLMIIAAWINFEQTGFQEKEVRLMFVHDDKKSKSITIKRVKEWYKKELKKLNKLKDLIEEAKEYDKNNKPFVPILSLQFIDHPLEQYPLDVYEWPEESIDIVLDVGDFGQVVWGGEGKKYLEKHYPTLCFDLPD